MQTLLMIPQNLSMRILGLFVDDGTSGSYGVYSEFLPQYQTVILAPQVVSNYEDLKVDTHKLCIKLTKTEGGQYIKL